MEPKIVVFIHGLFMNPLFWNKWIELFEYKGYVCHAPAYPFHNGEPEELRNNTDPQLGNTKFNDVYNFLEGYIGALPGKPVLIGHSIGGLLVQKLIESDLGSMGVCICSAPPLGFFTFKWSFLRSNLPILNPLKGNTPSLPSLELFHYSVCNTMSLKEAAAAYNTYVVPESRNIPRTSPPVNFKSCKRPLLFIAAEKDRVVPAVLNKRNYKAHKAAGNDAEYKEFKNR